MAISYAGPGAETQRLSALAILAVLSPVRYYIWKG